jgi:hypothetical protein
VKKSVRDPQGFTVLDLPALVRMKLTSNRPIDQVHVEDLLRLELITHSVRQSLPSDLLMRLRAIEGAVED